MTVIVVESNFQGVRKTFCSHYCGSIKVVKNSNKSLPQCIRDTLCFMWVNRRSVWVALWQQKAAPLSSAVEKRHKSNDNDGLVQSWASPDQTKCCNQYKCLILFNSVTCGLLQSHKPQESHNQPHAKLSEAVNAIRSRLCESQATRYTKLSASLCLGILPPRCILN